jgi:hypothetical protein
MTDDDKKPSFLDQLNMVLGKITRTLSESAVERSAKEMSQIEIGLLMLIAGYLSDPSLGDKSIAEIVAAISETPQGLEIITKALRGNGVETTDLEVMSELDKLLSRVLATGINAMLLACADQGIDVTPPCSSDKKFGDIGIEDPFKDSPQA